MTLKRYHAKRNFALTNEPRGALETVAGHRFVVQQHAARRMHYDLRLEMDGVLKSWAVPKGPSLNPAHKRLAVQTEDHPVAYASFEGVIPAGAYGGGRMIVWDEGMWSPIQDARKGLAKGHLAFTLTGSKLRGAWHLLRMGNPNSTEWLLCKVDDSFASAHGSITQDQPLSLYSGREVAQVEGPPAQVHRPNSNKALPPGLAPQLATASATVPTTGGWLYEVKLDGYRLMATRCDGHTQLLTRSGHDWSSRLPSIAAAVSALPHNRFALDGELVVLAEDGSSSFSALQDALASEKMDDMLFCAFDLLVMGNQDLRQQPLRQRKAALKAMLMQEPKTANIRYWPHVTGAEAGKRALDAAKTRGLEGIVAKRAASSYAMARNRDWLKIKCVLQEDFAVVGYLTQEGTGALRSLLVAQRQDGGLLKYAGKVGTGLSHARVSQLRPALGATNATKRCPCPEAPALGGAHWVKPTATVVVRFAQWTPRGHLRHATLLGLREDEAVESPQKDAANSKPGGPAKAPSHSPATQLTHPNRKMAPDSAVTKAKLVEYMAAMSPFMLPYVMNRPLSVLRCPEPDLQRNFFHKHLQRGMPGLGEAKIDHKNYSFVETSSAFAALVQLAVLELHPWGSSAPNIESPNTLVFDLDPAEGLPAAQTVAAAKTMRRILRTLGLKSLLKATGGKGLHVVVPNISGCTWPEAKALSQLVAHYVVARDAAHFTASMRKASRPGKIFIDYHRNGRGSTAIAPYSTRARPGLPIARPVAWAHLNDATLLEPWDVPQALGELKAGYKDPWHRFRTWQHQLDRSMLDEAMKFAESVGPSRL